MSKGSNSECGVVAASGVVEVVDLHRTEVRSKMEDCRTAGEEIIDGRFNGDVRIEENYLLSSVFMELSWSTLCWKGITPIWPAKVQSLTVFSPQRFVSAQSQSHLIVRCVGVPVKPASRPGIARRRKLMLPSSILSRSRKRYMVLQIIFLEPTEPHLSVP